MSKIIESIDRKVSELLAESSTLIESLENFGWKDKRPRKTQERVTNTSLLESELFVTTTIPARARIPTDFVHHYQKWYAASLAMIESNMPSRLAEFIYLHEGTKSDAGARDILMKDTITFVDQISLAQRINQLAGIVASIPNYLEARLHDLELSIAQAYVNDELSEARVLLKAGHVRAAGAIAGVLVERHLRLLCDRYQPQIKYPKTAGISKLNDLLKEAGSYDVMQWRKVQWMGDVRNGCDHPSKKEPRQQDVDELIAETRKFIALFVI